MSKRISKAGNIKYALSGDDDFIASVDPGEAFVVECAISVNDLGQQQRRRDASFR
jgi:amidase